MTDAEASALLGYVDQARAAAHRTGQPEGDELIELLQRWWAEDAERGDDIGERLQQALRDSGGTRFREMHEW
jgi:hypothetical protein